MMDDKEIEDLIKGIDDGKDITNNSIFKIMVALNNRVKQLYQQTYPVQPKPVPTGHCRFVQHHFVHSACKPQNLLALGFQKLRLSLSLHKPGQSKL